MVFKRAKRGVKRVEKSVRKATKVTSNRLIRVVVGGTDVLVKPLVDKHCREMSRILRLREEKIQQLQSEDEENARERNQNEKELHRHAEIQEIFKLFQLEVEQARKIVEEAEYTSDNGEKIKGFQGKHLSIYHRITHTSLIKISI